MSRARTIAAFHEAGHVVAAVLLGGQVPVVAIDDGDDGGGRCAIRWPVSAGDQARREALFVAAGPVAERLRFGSVDAAIVAGDQWCHRQRFREPVDDFGPAERVAERLVRARWGAIARVAAALSCRRSLTREDVVRLMVGGGRR